MPTPESSGGIHPDSARKPRIDIPGLAQHIVQRGNDRQPCFFQDEDRKRFLMDLRELALREHCRVHAYALMTNHVHLLLTPNEAGRLGHLMQSLGRRYVRHINDRYHRTGTLWEGRYKSSAVMGERHLLQCQRYIELNPVRAAMVTDPLDYPWSSHRAYANGDPDPLLHAHPSWNALGNDLHARQKAWRALVMEAVSNDETEAIRRHLQSQHLYAPDRFRRAIEAQLGRAVGPRKPGRPRKEPPQAPPSLEMAL